MKKRWVFAAIAIVAAIAVAGCAGGAQRAEEQLPPPGTERLVLENGAYALFRFDLPPGAVWGDFARITADYKLSEAEMRRSIRHFRLMGAWSYEYIDYFAHSIQNDTMRVINLGDDVENPHGTGTNNGPFIMDNNMGQPPFGDWGAVADEWFTVTYNITGARAHGQFDRANAVPAADAAGPFIFGLGLAGDAPFRGVTQYIRNVTLHHRTDSSLNVVSTGSGFDVPAFASFHPVMSSRVAGPPLPAEEAAPEAYGAYAYEEAGYY